MKEYMVYELEVGDKLYWVTDDNEIKEITLTEEHLAEKRDENFWCYYRHKESYNFIIKNGKYYYINQPKLRSKNGHVPVYTVHCEDYGRTRKIYLLEADDIKVYAAREAAKKEVAKRKLTEFKEDFFANIYKVEIFDAISNRKLYESMKVKSAKTFNKFKKKVAELEEGGAVTTKIETSDGLTFTVEQLEANLQSKITKLTDK